MAKNIALKGHYHVCPKIDPGPKPHVGGPIVEGSDFFKVNGMPVALKGDKCLCVGAGATDKITSGSSFFKVNGVPVARKGDSTAHGGKIAQGSSLLKIG